MNKKPAQPEDFDEHLELKVSPEFLADLNDLLKPQFSIPFKIDRAVKDRAHKQLARMHWGHRILRHISIWRVAAAAAVIIGLSIGLLMGLQTSRQSYQRTTNQIAGSSGLIDVYRFDYLTEAPENSLSRTYIQMVSGTNNFEE